jgi:hypothetical protein
MSIDQNLRALENRAVSAMRNIDPHTGTIHDYRNILMYVDRAMRAVNNAYIAISRAEDRLQDIANNQ